MSDWSDGSWAIRSASRRAKPSSRPSSGSARSRLRSDARATPAHGASSKPCSTAYRTTALSRSCAGAGDGLSRGILILWQTSLLRRGRPTVVDEVANGLSYYDHTFFRELPRLYADLEDGLAAVDPAWRNTELPSFIRMGSWIGGDRDGNPFVNADVLRQAIDMQSKRVLDFYLDELHLLGGELSLNRSR